MPSLICHQVRDYAPELRPGRAERDWMDATDERFAYRCLPLTVANAMGWELIVPARLTARWNGGDELEDLGVEVDDPAWGEGRLALSHFGHGVLTFNTGYVFRTEPGIGIWARGAPNWVKHGIQALDGLVETDWLHFTFTMNWRFTAPGEVSFEAGEPFCFITPFAYRSLDEYRPEIREISKDPALADGFEDWKDRRLDFNERLRQEEEGAVRQKWQKWYFRGETPTGDRPNPKHLSKVRLHPPRRAGEPESGET